MTPRSWAAGALLAAAAALGWLAWDDGASAMHAPAPPAAPPPGALAGAGLAATAPQPDAARAQRLRELQAALHDARQRLASYLAATVYPFDSRPAAEQRDQLRPFDPVIESRPLLTAQGEPLRGRHLVTRQDRVFVGGQDSVVFAVSMVDDQRQPLPLRVLRAVAREAPSGGAAAVSQPAALQFDDRGTGGDAIAGDGTLSARLQPAAQGFAAVRGTIRVELDLQAAGDGGAPGHAFFDIVYTPEVPATWTGDVRESMELGSLAFFLGAQVREPGRYVVSARVYDATGRPFALLQFNDELPAGPAQVKLTLFGKLVRDARPVFPLTLRDVDGYRLIEDRFPDRALMPRRAGIAHTSARYVLDAFADAQWSSEQRTRYLTELGRDVAQADAALKAAQGR